jgi:SHS2 domain-containing protein
VLGGIDRDKFSLEAVGIGERFDRERHASGTEVKAITYSAMRILEDQEKKEVDIWVIVDI